MLGVRRSSSPLGVRRGYLIVGTTNLFVAVDACKDVARVLKKTTSISKHRQCSAKELYDGTELNEGEVYIVVPSILQFGNY